MIATFTPATPAQLNYIATLTGYPVGDDNRAEFILALVEGDLSKSAASKRIDELKSGKSKPVLTVKTVTAPAVSKGEWHCVNGEFYRVSQSQSTGKLYAKRRNMVHGGFDYAAGIVFKLSAATRVNAEHVEAIKAFAAEHGNCLFCGKEIDTPESTTAGYGPKCAKDNGLPWG